MPKEYLIIGKNLTPEKIEEAHLRLEGKYQKGLKPLEGEPEKTEKEIKIIERVNYYLKKELKSLGVEDRPNLLPEQIHIVPSNFFSKKSPDKKWTAFYNTDNQTIWINKSKTKNVAELFLTVLHEAIHLFSFHSYFRSHHKQFRIGAYRSGYSIEHPKYEHGHFLGLNEAVTDKMMIEIFNKCAFEEFKVDPDLISIKSYEDFIKILDKIIEKIAEKNEETEETVWQRFKKELFTGQMMHLRDIERTFGQGALRIVGAIASGTKTDLREKTVNRKILKYFETKDEKEKKKIAQEILNQREYEQFRKRAEKAPDTRR